MNERIKQLFGQALDSAVPETYTLLNQAQITRYTEKFAELIVQECLNTLQKRYMGDNNREDMEVLRCVETIKNHFGVEE